MPKHLIDRFRPDSIREFRAAACERYRDGVAARESGRRTAAIYLFGYAAETTLKAAYFSVVGFPETQPLGVNDLRQAASKAPLLNFSWQGNFHSLESWAKLLVLTRASDPKLVYAEPSFATEVVAKVKRITVSWREVMRYHKNIAYSFEVARVEDAAKWLLDHSFKL